MFSEESVLFVIDPETNTQYPIIAGGDSTGDGETDVLEEGALEAGGDGDGSAGGSQQRDANGQVIPKYRFDQLNRRLKQMEAQLQAYSKHGSPEEIAASLDRFKKLSTGKTLTEDEITALEADFKQLPMFKGMVEYFESQKKTQTEESRRFLTKSKDRCYSDYIKDLGWEPKDDEDRLKKGNLIQATVAEIIRMDPDLLSRWRRNDPNVMSDAFKIAKSEIFGGQRRSLNADKQRVKQGGAKPVRDGREKASAASKTDDDDGVPRTKDGDVDERAILRRAANRGFARLQAAENEE